MRLSSFSLLAMYVVFSFAWYITRTSTDHTLANTVERPWSGTGFAPLTDTIWFIQLFISNINAKKCQEKIAMHKSNTYIE